MKYLSDLHFGLILAVAIAAVILLGTSARFRGKHLLLGFILLEMLSYAGYLLTSILLRSEAMGLETYQKFVEPAGVIYAVLGLTAWVLLLAFVSQLKSGSRAREAVAGGQFTKEPMTVARALFSFDGRLCRSDYWLKGVLPLLPVSVLTNFLAYGVEQDWAWPVAMGIALLSSWPGLALIVKRLHDRDRSGWYALLILIPIVGQIILLAGVWFMKGTDGPNRFGPDPLGPAPAPASASVAAST